MKPRNKFERTMEKGTILSPLMSFEKDTHEIEHRRDPLTGYRSIIGLRLTEKYKTLVGESDVEFIQELVDESTGKCFFCPGKVTSATPKFLSDDVERGRITVGEAILFPNLFPLSEYHAIIVPSKKHFLRPDEFTAALLTDALVAAHEFMTGIDDEKRLYASINTNYMPPAGASAIHPHFQIILSSTPSNYTEEVLAATNRYYDLNHSSYWEDLIEDERAQNERYIGDTGTIRWLTSFSPRGMNEVIGIGPSANFTDFSEKDLESLGTGIANVLSFYGKEGYSSFNISINAGKLRRNEPYDRVITRLVTRQNVSKAYRAGEHFFQHLLETEVVVTPPEILAREVSKHFEERR